MARYQPALLGGLFIGVLSALPVLNFANCCCLWVILGGMLTVYLDQQNLPTPIETSKAAFGGLLAGALGGVIMAIATQLWMLLTGGAAAQREVMDQMLSQMNDMPPEMVEMIQRFTTGPAAALITAAITIPVFAVFGMLGALLGTVFFRKKVSPDTYVGPGPGAV
jgi:hypothetical protein